VGEPGGTRRPAVTTGTAALLVVAAAGLSLARQSGAGALNTIYAEDGSVFLGSSYAQSTLDSITSPYAGYLHLVPRILSEIVSALPVSWAAAGLAIAAAVVTGLLALLVYACTADYLAPWGRVLAAAVVVLVPVGQDELPNSIANLHWPMLYALFWVLIARRLSTSLAVVSVLLISLSDLLVLVFAPLALWLWWRRRSPYSLAVGIALAIGLTAQAAAVLFGQSDRQLHPEPVKWAPWYIIRAVPESVLGQRWFPADVNVRWLLLAAIAWLVVLAVALYAFRTRSRSTGWRLAALAGVYSVAVYALPVALSGQATPRYAAASAMLLVAAAAAIFLAPASDGTAPASREKRDAAPTVSRPGLSTSPIAIGTWAGVALVAFCAAVWAVNLRVPNERGNGPLWSDQLAKSCAANAAGADVPITPPGWTVHAPCPR
jgi:hypothetical protein